jgi:predicted dienelactone hydrolase
MLLKHFACIFLPLLFFLSFLQAASLGVRTLEYKDETRKRPITIELWYPTEETGPFDAATHSTWIHPQEIRNAKISSKQSKYPLLLMSHGHRGDRRERTWLADALAKEGYIVAAIDHYGDTKATFNPLLSLCFWNRPLDFSFALDKLLNDLSIQDRIDTAKIGFVGYSLGGMTGLSLAGAQAKNVRAIVLQNIKNYGSGITPEMISQIDFSQSEKNYLEPRIKAILLICPAIFVYPAESLKQIKIPIGLIAAIGDEVLPHKNHSYQIIKYAIPKKLKVMRKEISHYSFLNRLSEMGKKIFQKHLQADPPCCDRASIHREASLFAIDFFKETLKIN